MRVPFRSREQRRGRHSPDGSQIDVYPGANNGAENVGSEHTEAGNLDSGSFASFEDDAPPTSPETSPELDDGMLDSSDELGDGREVAPSNVTPSNVTVPVPDDDLEDHRQTESLDDDDLIDVGHSEVAREMTDTKPSIATDSRTGASEVKADSRPRTRNDQAPAVPTRTDARITGSGVSDEADRERPPLPRIIAVANQKGGVGKTTTAVNLGAGLAELGFRVLVIDLDPQGNATTGLGIDARNFEVSMYDVIMKDVPLEDCIEPTSLRNLFVAPATIDLAGAEIELVPSFSREFKLRKAISTVVDDFDYVLIDCPPSLGLITINGLAAANEVLVPIQCEYYALEGLSQLLRNVQLVQSNLNETLEVSTIVLTMYDARTKLADQVASEVRMHFGARVCRIVIPRTVRISEAPSFGQPITVFDPTSRGAIAYRELAKEVSGGET